MPPFPSDVPGDPPGDSDSEAVAPVPAPREEEGAAPPAGRPELPVVARMVIEVRSDGLRTQARGALEDLVNEQTVAVELPAVSPGELGAEVGRAFARLLGSTPGLGRLALGALVPERLRRLKRRVIGRSQESAG